MKQKRYLLRSFLQYPFLIGMGGLLLVFSIWFLCRRDTVFSESENRFLARMPELSADSLLDSSFMKDYETYVNEQFPLREQWITAKAGAEALLGKQENNGIIRGKNGYLFAKDMEMTEQADKNVELLLRFSERAGAAGINTAVSVIPNSNAVLTEYLPKGAPVLDQKDQIEKYRERFENRKGVVWLDLTQTLLKHSGEPVYYRTDHHWTTLGAYYAYEAFIQNAGLEPVGLDGYESASHRIPGFYGTYDAKYKGIGVEPDTITYYDIPAGRVEIDGVEKPGLYDKSKEKVRDKYALFLYGNNALTEITREGEKNGRRLLILKDSYANCLVPFLIPHYDTICVVDLRYYNKDVLHLAQEKEITDMWLLYNFDTLVNETHFYRLKE